MMQRGFLAIAALIALSTTGLAGDQSHANFAPISPGQWEFTDLLRNFSVSADGKREIENGGSGPNVGRMCITKHSLEGDFLYPGLRNPIVAAHCKVTVISKTPHLIDSVVECSTAGGVPPTIDHTVVIAPTSKAYTIVRETTFVEANGDGSISRSANYTRARWIKDRCD